MDGYAQLEDILMGRDFCVLIMTNGESVDNGHVDVEAFEGREPNPKKSIAQSLNAKSAEHGLREVIEQVKTKRANTQPSKPTVKLCTYCGEPELDHACTRPLRKLNIK